MKHAIAKYLLPVLSAVLLLTACEKIDDLPYYGEGEAPQLSASSQNIAPVMADSNNVALTLNWTVPTYGISEEVIKYIVQVDVASNNFASPLTNTLSKEVSLSYIAKELNNFLLARDYPFNVAVDMQARVISSYANNNQKLTSNVVAFKFTPYVVPPKVDPPASGELYLVGASSAGGWNNPVPALTQKFKKISTLLYEGEFYLQPGEFLILPVNGSWDSKFALQDNTVPGINQGGSFGYYANANPTAFNSNFKGPDKAGMYKIALDFQAGKFTVTNVSEIGAVYMAGSFQGWSPETAPGIGEQGGADKFEGYVNITTTGNEFKFTSQRDWGGTNYGDDGPGKISTSGGNIVLANAGYYKINVNTTDLTWSALPVTWGLIGDFNGWGGDVPMTYDAGGKVFTATLTVPAAGGFKFRANGGWDINLGDKVNGTATGTLRPGGDNIPVAAGTYTVKLHLENPGYYWYEID